MNVQVAAKAFKFLSSCGTLERRHIACQSLESRVSRWLQNEVLLARDAGTWSPLIARGVRAKARCRAFPESSHGTVRDFAVGEKVTSSGEGMHGITEAPLDLLALKWLFETITRVPVFSVSHASCKSDNDILIRNAGEVMMKCAATGDTEVSNKVAACRGRNLCSLKELDQLGLLCESLMGHSPFDRTVGKTLVLLMTKVQLPVRRGPRNML